jgi:hypothetical protein
MSRQGLAELWRKRLDDCAQSGRSVVDWCYYNKVTVPQYYYWKRRLAAEPPQPTHPQEFIPLDILPTAQTPPAVPAGVTVRIAGATIDVTPGFDPDLLRAVVGALAAISC